MIILVMIFGSGGGSLAGKLSINAASEKSK